MSDKNKIERASRWQCEKKEICLNNPIHHSIFTCIYEYPQFHTRSLLTSEHALINNAAAGQYNSITTEGQTLRRYYKHVSREQVCTVHHLQLFDAASQRRYQALHTTVEENHFSQAHKVAASLHEADYNTNHGYNENAYSIVNILFINPKSDGKNLKHEEGVQYFFEKKCEISFDLHINNVGPVTSERKASIR